MPVNWARSCGGRRPSSTWPTATRPRAPASVGIPAGGRVAFRGAARWWLGRPGWRDDLHDAVAMARSSDPVTLAAVVAWTYGFAIPHGVLRADDFALCAIEEAVQIAEGSGNDLALAFARVHVGCCAAASRRRGGPSPRTGPDGAGPRRSCASVLPSCADRRGVAARERPVAANAMMPSR